MKYLGVVIPTVVGRELELKNCLDAYKRTLPKDSVYVIVRNKPTCGEAWNEGVSLLPPCKYLHFSADDLIPYGGWWQRAVWGIKRGYAPGAFLYDSSGQRNQDAGLVAGEIVPFSRVPFLTWDMWALVGPIPPLHYYSDVLIGERLSALGTTTRLVGGYAFIHTMAQPGRIRDDTKDRELYEASR